MIGFGQLTYVPDDVFEEYIETNIPLADNGLVNDNYVLTAGLDLYGTALGILGITLSPQTLTTPIINDFTGIQDFVNCGSVLIQNLNSTTIDLSQMTLNHSPIHVFSAEITISSCPLVTDIILPSDSFALTLLSNTYLTNIVLQPSTYLYHTSIIGCNSLLSFDISNISGVFSGLNLEIEDNLNLDQLNLQNGFCYNWGMVMFNDNSNLFCIQVDDPNYSSISANWGWSEFIWENQNNQYSYSTNCGYPSAIQEYSTNKELLKVTDLLGRETKQTNKPLFYIYNDGKVEKRIVIE